MDASTKAWVLFAMSEHVTSTKTYFICTFTVTGLSGFGCCSTIVNLEHSLHLSTCVCVGLWVSSTEAAARHMAMQFIPIAMHCNST